MGVLNFFYFLFYLFFIFSNQRSYGNDHRGTDVHECEWLTCSHLVQLWQPPLEWWLQGMTVFLVSISAAQEWNNMVWILVWWSPPPPLGPKCWPFWTLFPYRCCRFTATNLYPVGLIIPKTMMHSFSAHGSSFLEGLVEDLKAQDPLSDNPAP